MRYKKKSHTRAIRGIALKHLWHKGAKNEGLPIIIDMRKLNRVRS
jgi:hypothetical protein